MFDDLKALFFENALASYNAFIQAIESKSAGGNNDLRLARDAAVTLFHLHEHIPWARIKPRPSFLSSCPEFALLEDVANVFKHAGPRREGQIEKATDVYELDELVEYEDANGPYQHVTKLVVIQLRDGSLRDMREVLTLVMNMWISEFTAHGVLIDFDLIQPKPHQVPPRESVGGAAVNEIRMLPGVRFTRAMRRAKYDYGTRRTVSVDMTGHQYQFSVYKPTEFSISITNPTTGETLEKTGTLSPEEDSEYRSLDTR